MSLTSKISLTRCVWSEMSSFHGNNCCVALFRSCMLAHSKCLRLFLSCREHTSVLLYFHCRKELKKYWRKALQNLCKVQLDLNIFLQTKCHAAGVTCNDIPGRVEEWHIPRKNTSKWVCYRSQTSTRPGMSLHDTNAVTPGYANHVSVYICSLLFALIHESCFIKPKSTLHLPPFGRARSR